VYVCAHTCVFVCVWIFESRILKEAPREDMCLCMCACMSVCVWILKEAPRPFLREMFLTESVSGRLPCLGRLITTRTLTCMPITAVSVRSYASLSSTVDQNVYHSIRGGAVIFMRPMCSEKPLLYEPVILPIPK
jgi:hypothetical protein